MRIASASIHQHRSITKIDAINAPVWVTALTGLKVPATVVDGSSTTLGVLRDADFCRVAVKIAQAVDLNAGQLLEQVHRAYQSIFAALGEAPSYAPVRFWNFLPGINDRFEGTQNRYMVFNSGRYRALQSQFGSDENFDQHVPTASAVGHDGSHLWIHCLASRKPGVQLHNPRQIQPHRYSARFGKNPPCFARATYLDDRELLLIGGTASICGENSRHNDLSAQTDETLVNLQLLIETSAVRCGRSIPIDPLGCLIDLRVYHPHWPDAGWLEQTLRNRLPLLKQLTLVRADLCRGELQVEIEGIARLMPSV